MSNNRETGSTGSHTRISSFLAHGRGRPPARLLGSYPDSVAPTFEEEDVTPRACHLTKVFSSTNLSETAALQKTDTRGVLGEYAALQSPHARGFRFID